MMKKLLFLIVLIFFGYQGIRAQSIQHLPSGFSAIDAYSIYLGNYQNDAYEEAMKFGRWIWKDMPPKIEGYSNFDLPKNMERMAEVYAGYSQTIDDPTVRSAYLDTAQIIYKKTFDNLSDQIDAYKWHFNRGRFYQENADFIEDAMNKAVADYKKAYQEDPEKLTKLADGYYLKIILQNLAAEGKKDEAFSLIEQASAYDDGSLDEFFDSMRSDLFETNEERIAFYEGKLEENPEDLEALNTLRDLYTEEEMNGKLQTVNNKLYELNPNLENTRALARFAIKNANYSNAIKYLKEALDKAKTAKVKAELALELADAYLNNENLQQARKYARQAADMRSGWGAPYIKIGDIYAEAVNACTSGRKIERTDRAVYWLAVDYYNKARNVDSAFSNDAKRKISAYKPVLPSAEDVHFESGWDKGNSLTINSSLNSCYSWINESTTIR